MTFSRRRNGRSRSRRQGPPSRAASLSRRRAETFPPARGWLPLLPAGKPLLPLDGGLPLLSGSALLLSLGDGLPLHLDGELSLPTGRECSLPPRAKLLPPPVGSSPAVERQTSHCRTASFPAVGQRTSFVVGRQTFLTVGRQIPLAGGKRASPAVARGRRCFLRLVGRRCTDLPVCEWLCKPLISEAFRLTVWPAFPKRDFFRRLAGGRLILPQHRTADSHLRSFCRIPVPPAGCLPLRGAF